MAGIKINFKNTGISQRNILAYKEKVENIHKDLNRRAELENDFVGWLHLPTNYDKKEFARICACTDGICCKSIRTMVEFHRRFNFIRFQS